jgi:hypothetical protein
VVEQPTNIIKFKGLNRSWPREKTE